MKSYILMFSVASVMLVARDEHSDPNAENGDTDREDEVGVWKIKNKVK